VAKVLQDSVRIIGQRTMGGSDASRSIVCNSVQFLGRSYFAHRADLRQVQNESRPSAVDPMRPLDDAAATS